MINFGKVKPGTTLYIPFSTFGTNGESLTLTGLATSDIEIYKDGSVTQRSSDSGYTLLDTDGIDIDGVTGLHGFSVNLADNSDAGFYASGSKYFVHVASVTVNSQTVNFLAATFEIEIPNAVLSTTIATLASQTSFTLTAGPAEDDALNGCVMYAHDVASAVQGGYAYVSDYTGSTKTVTLAAGPTFTMAATDNVGFFPPIQVFGFGGTAGTFSGGRPEVNTTHAAGTAWGSGAITAGSLATGAITAAKFAAGAIDAAALAADAGAEIADAVWDEATSGHASAGTYGLAVSDVLVDTADMQPKFGTFENLGSGATIAGNLEDMAYDGSATFSRATDSLQAIRDASATLTDLGILASTTIATLASQTSFTLTAGSADDNAYNDCRAIITDASTAVQKAIATILDYTGSTKTITLTADPGIFTMAAGDGIVIIPPAGSGASAASIADAVWDEARAGHVAAGSFGEGVTVSDKTGYRLSAQGVDDVWDEAQSGHTTAGTFGRYLDAQVANVETDTQDIQGRLPAALVGGRMDANVGAISGDSVAADNLESYTDGTTPMPVNVTQISGDATSADNLESYTDGTTPMPVNATQISGDATAADNLEAALDGTGGVTISAALTGNITGNLSGSVGSVSGNVGGNVAGSVGSVTALSAAAVDSILDEALTELAAVPAAAPSLRAALQFLYMAIRNRTTTTASAQTIQNDAGSTIATASLSDDGVTYTKGEFA